MKQQFITNIVILILVNIIIKPLYIFGIETEVQNIIGIETYGLYFDYFNFVLLFQFINDPGLQNWNTQHVTGNRDSILTHLVPLFITKFLLGLIFLLVVFVVAALSGHTEWWLLLFASLNLFLSTFFLLIRSCISGLGLYKSDSLLSTIDKLVMIIILGAIIWIPHRFGLDLKVFVLAQSLSYIIACIIALIVLTRNIGTLPRLSFDKKVSKAMVMSASPYIWILIFMTLYSRLDGVLLKILVDDNYYQTGVFAASYRFYDAANMIGYLFAALLLPMFSYYKNDRKEIKALTDVSVRYAFVSAVLICAMIYFFGAYFMKTLLDAYDPSFLIPLYLLITAYWFVAMGYIYGTLLLACGHLGQLNKIFGLGLVVNVLINFILIPRYGATGAAISALITQVLVLVLQIFVAYQQDLIYHRARLIFIALFYIIAVGIIFKMVIALEPIHPIILCILASILCGILALLIRLIDIQSLASLLRKREIK
jgi:O-antigen/teichoic acid export membrane protein